MALPIPALHGAPFDRLDELLAFRAPYLDERLVKDRIARTHDEAARLFDEAKKYLVVSAFHGGAHVPMFSTRVDEAWHQFALYTRSYAAFCDRFFGRFVPHAPTVDGEEGGRARADRRAAYPRFVATYERFFGPLSELWDDARFVDRDTRVLRVAFRRRLFARATASHAELAIDRDPVVVLLRASARARAALDFVAETEIFYVRELPELDDEDRVALVRALMAAELARVAP